MRDKIYFNYYIYNKYLNKKCENITHVMRRRNSQIRLTIIDVNYFLIIKNIRANENHENHALHTN